LHENQLDASRELRGAILSREEGEEILGTQGPQLLPRSFTLWFGITPLNSGPTGIAERRCRPLLLRFLIHTYLRSSAGNATQEVAVTL